MNLTNKDRLAHAKNVPLHQISWKHVRGTMRSFAEADFVIMEGDGGKAKILKDRQGWFQHVPRDERGLVNKAELKRKGGEG